MMGFGGVMPFVHRSVVERNHWLSDREFAEMLSLCQVLPGANIVNLSAMLGYRFAGIRGAIASMLGLLLPSAVLLLAAAWIYAKLGTYGAMRRALGGMAAVSAGLVIATGLRLYQAQPRSIRVSVMAILSFAAIAVFHYRLPLVIGTLAPCAVLIEWFAHKAAPSGPPSIDGRTRDGN